MFITQLDSHEIYPHIKEKVDACMESSQEMYLVKHAEECNYGKVRRMCTHCGLMEDQFPTTYTHHIQTCRLEKQTCNCPDVTFNNPTEKRRHMRLVHSGRAYLSCPHCAYITPKAAGFIFVQFLPISHLIFNSQKRLLRT